MHLLINSSVMLATGVLTTINPHFRQGEPYWHIFLIWIFNYSVVPHQIRVKLGTRPDRFIQLQRGSRVLCSPWNLPELKSVKIRKQTKAQRIIRQHELRFSGVRFLLLQIANAEKSCLLKKKKGGEEKVEETVATDRQVGKMRMRVISLTEEPELRYRELEALVLTHIQPLPWQHLHTFLYVPTVLLCGSCFLTHHYPPLSSVSGVEKRIS